MQKLNDRRTAYISALKAADAGDIGPLRTRLGDAGRPILEQGATAWEAFLTSGDSTDYGDDADLGAIRTKGATDAAETDECC